jgi:hypothetical protein
MSIFSKLHHGQQIWHASSSEAFPALRNAAASDDGWQSLKLALGDADLDGAKFHVAGYSECSSLLPINDRHIKALPASACRRTESSHNS